jgi:DNA-binding transcriptional LysR family regulator
MGSERLYLLNTMSAEDRVSRRLKLSDLRMLLAIVQWGSMSKAAANLNISQSGVSKALRELEHTLGVRLLDRTPRGIEPTVYGSAILNRAIAIFDEVRQGMKDIESLADPTTGEVRVGCNEPITAGLLAAIIERLGRKYPRIVCHMVQTPTVATLESPPEPSAGQTVDVVERNHRRASASLDSSSSVSGTRRRRFRSG